MCRASTAQAAVGSAARLGAGTGGAVADVDKRVTVCIGQTASHFRLHTVLDGPVSHIITAQVGSITSFTSSRLTKVNGI